MFTTQISTIESQRQAILAKIEELSRQEQALVQESLQYREMEDEAVSLLGAIASLKKKFSNHENATSALFEEISKLFQPEKPPTEPEPQPEEWENLVEDEENHGREEEEPTSVDATTVDDGQLDIFTAIESVEAATGSCYESAAEIAAALSDEDEVDTHLMAIASILDTCPAIEIPGRVWFFVQNIPVEFDNRILGYLPKSVKFEWTKQRALLQVEAMEHEVKLSEITTTSKIKLGEQTQNYAEQDSSFTIMGKVSELLEEVDPEAAPPVQEPEQTVLTSQETKAATEPEGQQDIFNAIDEAKARESILPPNDGVHFFDIGDLVETPTGKVGHIDHVSFDLKFGRMASVVCVGGSFVHTVTSLKYIGKYQPPAAPPAATVEPPQEKPAAKKTKKSAKTGTAQDILKCNTWEEIRAIASNNPQLLKDAGIAAKTAREQNLIESLPVMIRDYILSSDDDSDLNWLPTSIKQRVQMLLKDVQNAAA